MVVPAVAEHEKASGRERDAWALDNDRLRYVHGQAARSLHLSIGNENPTNLSPISFTEAFPGGSALLPDSAFGLGSGTDGGPRIVDPEYGPNLRLSSILSPEFVASSPASPTAVRGRTERLPHASRKPSGRSINAAYPALAHRDRQYGFISQLSCLIPATYETLRVLEDGSWTANNSPESLEDYPIGKVLHLSQNFSDILREMSLTGAGQENASDWQMQLDPALQEHSPTGPAYKSPANTPPSFLSASGRPDIDTTTVLLVLSGYISLVKLHVVVFTHIEAHISTKIKQGPRSMVKMATDRAQDENLQFGELPFAEKVSAQAFTAVRMLLEKFRMVEEGIGLPNELCVTSQGNHSTNDMRHAAFQGIGGCGRCGKRESTSPSSCSHVSLISAVLMHDALLDGGNAQEGFPILLSKIQTLKGLLRQNLGLE